MLSMIEEPGSFAIVCVKTLRGYFLLTKGAEQEAVDTVAMPVAKALEADPGILNFPLCWNMCGFFFLSLEDVCVCQDVSDIATSLFAVFVCLARRCRRRPQGAAACRPRSPLLRKCSLRRCLHLFEAFFFFSSSLSLACIL